MKSFEQIAQAMCNAYSQTAVQLDEEGERVPADWWEHQSDEAKQCWVAAARKAAEELATVQ